MLEGTLGGLIGFLALVGVVGLALRFGRAVARLALGAAEKAAAAGLAEASARRGDLTTMQEARGVQKAASSRRTRDGLIALLWGLWITVPLVLGNAAEAWTVAAPLWLVPLAPVRARESAPTSIQTSEDSA